MLDAVAELAPHSRTQQVAPQHAHDTLRQRLRTPSWCVVQSHPQAERRAHANLHIAGFNAYLPLITRRTPCRHWRTTALFPGYLFVQLDLSKPWHPVIRCPGVYALISTEGRPNPCPDGLVEALRAGEAARSTPTTQEDLYRPGAACEAVLGGGQAVEGVVVAIKGEKVTVAAIMFGELREMTVGLRNLRLRN